MKKYKILLLDVDNTLLDFEKDNEKAFQSTISSLGIECKKEIYETYSTASVKLWKKLEEKEITMETLRWERANAVIQKYEIEIEPKIFYQKMSEQLRRTGTLIQGAEEVLEKLRKQYKLAVITNGPKEEQRERLKNAGIEEMFEEIFVSGEIGYNKPDIQFFHYVFEKISPITEKEALVIGDTISSDIQGGYIAGIDTCWYNPKQEKNATTIQPTYEIKDLRQLEEIL